MHQLPRHAGRSHLDLADLDPAGATIGIHTAEPKVMLASPINQRFKTRSKVFDLPTHALSASIRRIERYRKACLGGIRVRVCAIRLIGSVNPLNWSFVRPSGFEPETCGLRVRCSAVELEAHRRV